MPATPYDSTLKALVETEPESWPALFGKPSGPTQIIDADVATVSGAADKVLRVAAKPAYLLHLEFVAGHDAAALPGKLLVRNVLLDDRHKLRVRSGVVLLRPEADSPQLSGIFERNFPDEDFYLQFRYHVVRIWTLPPEALLTGGLALLPLAPISAVTDAELPGIIERIGQRLKSRRARAQAEVIWASAYVLFGLRHSPELAAQLFQGVVSMKESSTYQAILAEGRAKGLAEGRTEGLAEGRTEGLAEGRTEGLAEGRTEGLAEGRTEGAVAEAKKAIRVVGDALLGTPDRRTAAVIEGLDDLAQLEALLTQVATVKTWSDLVGRLGPRRRSQRPRVPSE